MKLWVWILILATSVGALCIWDGINTQTVFNKMETESNRIYEALLVDDISNEQIQENIINLNYYWTQKMDTLSVSISRKDMQPISDYLQYLTSSITNNNQEDAITYSRLLHYNVEGIKETNGIKWINLL